MLGRSSRVRPASLMAAAVAASGAVFLHSGAADPLGSQALTGHGRTSRIRSSFEAGSPRPSRFEVVTHRLPSGATSTVRSRP